MPLTQDEVTQLKADLDDLVSKKTAEDSADAASDQANAALSAAQTAAAKATADKNAAADATAASLGNLKTLVDSLAAPPPAA